MTVAERRTREKEARRQQILDAARGIFFEKGFEAATIDEIASKTELSKGAIYLYFGSKEEIYFTLMHEGSRILYTMLDKAARADLPADTLLRRVGHAYYQFYEKQPGYFRMLFLYYGSPGIEKKVSEELCQLCHEDAMASLSIVSRIIEKGIDDGIFKQCHALEYAIMLWTSQNGIIMLADRGDKEHLQLATSIDKLQDLFLESMIIALKAGR